MTWQPIETAPKDGEPIHLWIEGDKDDVSFYAPITVKRGDKYGGKGPLCKWARRPPNAANWYPVTGLDSVSGYPLSPCVTPTHWARPLPPPPKRTKPHEQDRGENGAGLLCG